MRKLSRFLILLLLLHAACAHVQTAQKEKPEDELVIVAITDFHSSLDLAEGVAQVVRQLREEYGEGILFLNAGDMFQGGMEGNLSKGKAVIDFFNLLPLDASAVGNHEMDFGEPREMLQGAKFPWLSANFIEYPVNQCKPGPGCNALGQKTIMEPRSVILRGNRKVGVIGITTPETMTLTRRDSLKGKIFEDMKKTVEAETHYLREKERVDWVVLTIHEGVYVDSGGVHRTDKGLYPLLKELQKLHLDAVIAGHTHQRIQKVVFGVPVLEASHRGDVIGVLKLKGLYRKPRTVKFYPWIPVPQTAEAPDVTATLKPYRERTAVLKNKVISSASGPFTLSYHEENPVSNLMSDALLSGAREKGIADFAILNAGGIRNKLPEGTIRYEDLFKTVPFDNHLVIVELTGAELRMLLEIAFSGELGMSAVSGLQIRRWNVPPGVPGVWDRDLNGDGKNKPGNATSSAVFPIRKAFLSTTKRGIGSQLSPFYQMEETIATSSITRFQSPDSWGTKPPSCGT